MIAQPAVACKHGATVVFLLMTVNSCTTRVVVMPTCYVMYKVVMPAHIANTVARS